MQGLLCYKVSNDYKIPFNNNSQQVIATEESKVLPEEVPKQPRTDGLSEELATHISGLAFSLGLTEEEQDVSYFSSRLKDTFFKEKVDQYEKV